MSFALGLVFAFGAMMLWGFGDFLIQRTTRKLGDWETLFVLDLIGMVILAPFVYADLPLLLSSATLWLLIIAALVLHAAAILNFEAMKKGKLAVVEPMFAVEVPVAAVLAFSFLGEGLGLVEILLVGLLTLGLVLVSMKSHHFNRKAWLERGVILAIAGSIFMGAANFTIGLGSRISTPLLAIWFTSIVSVVVTFYYLASKARLRKFSRDVRRSPKTLFTMGVVDNLAWLAFAYGLTLAPIAIVVALSESYIAIAALFGLLINREALRMHQKEGMIVALASAVLLASFVA